jgi:hypothetical protein
MTIARSLYLPVVLTSLLLPSAAAAQGGSAQTELTMASLRVEGPQVVVASTLFLGPGARLEIAPGTSTCGIAQWRPVIDGKEGTVWPSPWASGEHTAGAIVEDRCGATGAVPALSFVLDDAPPSLRSETGSLDHFEDRMPEPRRESRLRRRERNTGRKGPARENLLWSSGWDRWEALAGEVEIQGDHVQLFFRAPEGQSFEGKEVLWIAAEDAAARLDRIRFRTRRTQDGEVLEVEAVDLVGNVARKEWKLGARRTS